MKKIIILAVLCVMTVSAWGQFEKDYLDTLKKTKYTEFLLKRGVKYKIIDYKPKRIIGDKFHFGATNAHIRKIIYTDNGKIHYFLALKNKDKEYTFISYSDLTRLNKRIAEMREEFEIDKKQNTYITRNVYVTDDDFIIGYECRKVAPIWDKWFYICDRYSEPQNISDIDKAYEGFQTWQIAIEEEMQKDKK